MAHKIKTHVQCNPEQVGKTEFSDVLILMEMAGGMCKTHSLVKLHNGPMLMVIDTETMKAVQMQTLVQTLLATQPLIDSVVSIPMGMVARTLN